MIPEIYHRSLRVFRGVLRARFIQNELPSPVCVYEGGGGAGRVPSMDPGSRVCIGVACQQNTGKFLRSTCRIKLLLLMCLLAPNRNPISTAQRILQVGGVKAVCAFLGSRDGSGIKQKQ